MVNVTVLRDMQPLEFDVEIMPADYDPNVGLLGIMREFTPTYTPVMNFIEWNNDEFSMFVISLWRTSVFIALLNLLPLPYLDGGKFIRAVIYKRLSDKSVDTVMKILYGVTFVLLGLNFALSYSITGFYSM